MQVVALDLSLTGTGVVVNGSPRTITTKLRDEARIGYILDQIGLETAGTDSVVIVEGLAYGTQTGKAMERAGLWWCVKMQMWWQNIAVSVVPPTVLKKYITGKGNASKEEVLLATVRTFPDVNIKNNNEADSMVMYAMAMDHFGEPLVDLPKANRAVLDKVAWYA